MVENMNRAERRRQQKRAGHKPADTGSKPSTGLTLDQTLDMALQHHAAGRLPNAERIYHQILQSDPDHPIALNFLGVIAHQMGKHDIAVNLLSKALTVKPDYADAHNNIGNAFKALGRRDDAVAGFQQAVAIEQDFAEAHLNLGNEFRELGRLDDAVASLEKALASKPGFADAHFNLGICFKELGRLDDAVSCYQKSLAIKPDFARAHNNLGTALRSLGIVDESLSCYQKAVAIDPEFAEAHYNLGNAYSDIDRVEEAVASYQRALAIRPGYAEALNNLGNAFMSLGNLAESLMCYRKALAIRPEFIDAHRQIASLKTFTEYDHDIKSMEDAFARPDLADEQRTHLAFGLGKAFEDLQKFEKAFEFFTTGNAIKRSGLDFSIDDVAAHFNYLKELFNKTLFDGLHAVGSSDETPIFILGMPRSGTTLIEQILASHPEIHGGGERYDLQRNIEAGFGKIGDAAFADNINQARPDQFSMAGDNYIRGIRDRFIGGRHITDKMPNNFQLIGMIRLMLPNAKIIHCCRDPLDTCLSIFKNLFTANGHYYAYDLADLGRYYSLYSDLMNHWHHILPGVIHDIRYEDMVLGQETQTRALIEFCELDWDEACLNFQKTDRPVHTTSSVQIRKPIYKDSIQSWKRYENRLSPLRAALPDSIARQNK
jgi:tetratricopeptide (TPR) repeat protein